MRALSGMRVPGLTSAEVDGDAKVSALAHIGHRALRAVTPHSGSSQRTGTHVQQLRSAFLHCLSIIGA
eukprot:15465318-Alexandrium_andersonii.AAC.1